jgi:autotransporter-associated beta strand protein
LFNAANDGGTTQLQAQGTSTVLFTGNMSDNTDSANGITKIGTGTVVLSGNNTYRGSTTVNDGSLVVSNAVFTATIQSDSTTVNFTNTGGLTATLTNSPNLIVIVTSNAPVGPTFAFTYPSGSENTVDSNGLQNLMNYALGGTGPGSNPDLPVLTVNGSNLTLTATVRSNDPSLRFYGQWTTDLSGTTDRWEDHTVELTPPDLSFSQGVESDKPRKFMRFKATLIP